MSNPVYKVTANKETIINLADTTTMQPDVPKETNETEEER